LNPREQQQQSENCFDVDRDQEKCIDVEIHRAIAEKCMGPHPLRFPSADGVLSRRQKMRESRYGAGA
jgi:hypothetical protein